MENDSEQQMGRSLVKQLACCNKTTRDRALRVLLKTWLPSLSDHLSDDDAKKLWKGLFYCFWHSDKPLPQAELANRLSSLLLSLSSTPFSLQYLSTFFLTMRREWPSIDALRLDKFYLLIRRFISTLFSLLKKNSWDLELVRRYADVLDKGTFSAEDKFQGSNGVNYHFATVFLEELRPFLPVRVEVLDILFAPFYSVMGRVPDRVLLGKIKSGLFDVLLKNGRRLLEARKAGEEVASGDDVAVLGTVGLVMGFSGKLYGIGSDPGCCQGNRKVLFGLHEQFLKLEKDAAASGFEFSIPDSVDQDDDEEVPILVPVCNGMEVDALEAKAEGEDLANGKVLKKCKKDNKVGGVKKAKTKKKGGKAEDDSENVADENGGDLNGKQVDDEGTLLLNEAVMSNLQKQFEKVAAEEGLDDDGVASACDSPHSTSAGAMSKKRKRTKNLKGKKSQDSEIDGGDADDDAAVAMNGEKSAKKVRFSMKSNLVWKPHTPLPPQSLRLPPSAAPRGSALKKGVPPGPIREMLPPTKKPKAKKARRVIKGVVGSVKRLKKLRTRSA
ncbi:hypothetical protein HN51_064353 [Arachis hypogaea]|nr:ribosomal RNA processing protein 1 homolog isoform X1 [Arachis ipaensis]XP_025630837.1 ribosomal RNA processing protein 1 homolog isoform X1 [Arachis hypogaea]QHO21991.1 uncharacterized protein DS421_11g351360 [Arachis hypogaea]